MIDERDPCPALGLISLKMLSDYSDHKCREIFGNITETSKGYTHWQYGAGLKASEKRSNLWQVDIDAVSHNGRPIGIKRIVFEGSSQQILDPNITREVDTIHNDGNTLIFSNVVTYDYISFTDKNMLSLVELQRIVKSLSVSSVLCTLSTEPVYSMDGSQAKAFINKVHKHICGHATFTDFKLLLETIKFWNTAVAYYFTEVVKTDIRAALPLNLSWAEVFQSQVYRRMSMEKPA